jgi:hypothetical protein
MKSAGKEREVLLVVEVSDISLSCDRNVKLPRYAAAGISGGVDRGRWRRRHRALRATGGRGVISSLAGTAPASGSSPGPSKVCRFLLKTYSRDLWGSASGRRMAFPVVPFSKILPERLKVSPSPPDNRSSNAFSRGEEEALKEPATQPAVSALAGR